MVCLKKWYGVYRGVSSVNPKKMKEIIKTFWKPFAVIFLLSFLLVNWTKIDWGVLWLVSDYRFVSASIEEGLNLDGFLNFDKELDKIGEWLGIFRKPSILKIPKIGIEAPLVFVKNANNGEFDEALKRGVLHYPGSGLPGNTGQTVILGHSAPAGWPKVNYEWIFTDLNKLVEGDEIHIDFQDKQYVYKVQGKFILKAGQEIPDARLTNNESVIILLSCWPPGKNYKRLAVEAALE